MGNFSTSWQSFCCTGIVRVYYRYHWLPYKRNGFVILSRTFTFQTSNAITEYWLHMVRGQWPEYWFKAAVLFFSSIDLFFMVAGSASLAQLPTVSAFLDNVYVFTSDAMSLLNDSAVLAWISVLCSSYSVAWLFSLLSRALPRVSKPVFVFVLCSISCNLDMVLVDV